MTDCCTDRRVQTGVATRNAMFLAVAILLSAAVPGGDLRAQEGESRRALSPELERVREALDVYRDPVRAVHDGYLSTVGCVTFPEPGGEGEVPYAAGAMGVHFINMGLVGPELDPLRPQVLIYEPVGEELELVAAEWFVPMELSAERPELFGHPFDGPMAGHHPLMPSELHHWDLHVWLWRENPEGLFAPTNPAVACPEGAPYTIPERAPPLISVR